MWFPTRKAKKAIREGNVEQLKQVLDAHPEMLDEVFRWSSDGIGRVLNMAAYYDQPGIVEYLVKEKHADPNRDSGFKTRRTPLHHTEMTKAYKAALKLLELGANPQLPDASRATTVKFAKEARATDPAYVEKQRQLELERQEEQRKTVAVLREREAAEKLERIAGKWTLTGSAEVTHEYDLKDGSHRLKDIFNFQTRLWRAVVTDLKTNAIAQNIIFFDSMPDGTALLEPLQKLKELGGTADESALPGSNLPKKGLKPTATP